MSELDEELAETLGLITVVGASGAEFDVLHPTEKAWFEHNLGRYLQEYRFENVADLQDLDRLLGMELLSYRFANWLIRDSDYEGNQFDEKGARSQKDALDKEIRLLKKQMGMDRKARMEDEQQSVAEYLKQLMRRAEEFGVHRDSQIAKAMDLFNDLKKLMGLHLRSDEEEQLDVGATRDDVFQWILEVAIPEYDRIDDEFRKNQRLWIREVG